jgi:hypothetical protein
VAKHEFSSFSSRSLYHSGISPEGTRNGLAGGTVFPAFFSEKFFFPGPENGFPFFRGGFSGILASKMRCFEKMRS